jgi:LysM domain-containing protein
MVRPRVGRGVVRFAVPAAFLLAVTIAVLLIRSGLDVGQSRATATPREHRGRPPITPGPQARPQARPSRPVRKRYYVIQSGDTFELLAIHFDTSVDRLVLLNPGIEPTALTPGERVRIR